MPTVTRGSEHLIERDTFFSPAVLSRSIVGISVLSTGVTITRIEGWYGKTHQRVTVERQYDDVSQASLRRLGKAVSNMVNKGKAAIHIDQVAGFMCYEAEL